MSAKRPVLFTDCSIELQEETAKAAKARGMTVGGLVREAVVRHLGLPSDLIAHQRETKTQSRPGKKKLARVSARD